MTAGARRHLCELQGRTVGVDELGQPFTTWSATRTFWGDIRFLSGLAAIKAGADTSVAKVSIRALHGPFDSGQRVINDGKVYEIQAVLPDGKNKHVDLVCIAVTA